MALILKDRVKETSASSGTGSVTLGGAFAGYQTFNAAITTGSTVYYTIHNLTAGSDTQWEVGVGTFTSPATLSRDTVFSSSNSGSKVNFTAGVSGLEVFITQPASEAVYINDATGRVEAFGNGANTITFTNINTTNLTATTVTLTSGTITTNAANNTDIVNKLYVDGITATALTYHEAVQAATTQSLAAQTGGTVTYNQPNGAGNGVGATITLSVALNTLDGYSLLNTNRVLVKDETNQTFNGIYTWATGGTVLTRATDANTYGSGANQLSLNDYFFVQNGSTNRGTAWVLDAPSGTITFGTSNITFAQFSSAQIYAAGTGLNLANLTFSIANTAVTAATYGNAGAVATFTVNAQGQLTNAANTAINASSISVGTLANARTTASDANGASTIVSRDANGGFTANTITATTSNATTFNGTTGNFTSITGNAVALTAINASNITSGTIANARTTANTSNSASTIVVRDANGAFEGGNVTAANFIGGGTTITSINASNISSGTIANARTTAASANGASTIVVRDGSGGFGAGDITALSISGNGVALTAINASNIASGTIANARTSASSSNGASTIVLRGASGEFAAGTITGTFSGDGSAVSAINGSNVTTGTVANARTTAASANGASTIVLRGTSGEFAAGVITADGSGLSAINASSISTGTIANARTTAASANGASTIVTRGTSGEFSAGAITSTSISGNGASLTAINASAISSGTLAIAQGGTGASSLAGANIPVTNVANTFTGLQTFAGTSSNADLKTSNILEVATISATAATGTINYDVTTQSVLYYTSNASGNFTVNFRGSSGTSLNTIMSTGESLSVTFLVTNGSTAYYNSAVTIDGNSVTPKWQGGSAPTSGNASSIDSYTYVIFKTGSATFTVLASVTKFA